MASRLVVLGFEGIDTASGVLANIRDMEKRGIIKLEDAVVAQRGWGDDMNFMMLENTVAEPTEKRDNDVKIIQSSARRSKSAAAGAGVGLLAGFLLGGPIGGLAVGALIGGLHDRGIDDKFVQDLGDRLKPGTSALFLLVKEADGEKVLKELAPFKAQVLHTTLTPEAEKKLRETLDHEQ
jgi:uncharacterized membrane protein